MDLGLAAIVFGLFDGCGRARSRQLAARSHLVDVMAVFGLSGTCEVLRTSATTNRRA